MPRPLPKKSRISKGINEIYLRPELAVMIAQVATNWSRVEERLGFIVVQMLRAEAHTGMKMYQALSGSTTRKAVLRAVARDRLSKAMQDELEELLSTLKTVAGKRNDIVHGHWYVSEDHPDELVWTDASEELLGYSEFWSGYNAAKDFAGQMDFARGYKGKPPKRFLYNKADFEAVLKKISILGNKLANFNIEVEKLHRPARDQASVGRV